MNLQNEYVKIFIKIKKYIWGTFWVIFSIALFIAIFSYNKNDISLNTVSTTPETNNLLGLFGSYMSDFFLQMFGFSSIIFTFIFFLLGFKIFLKRSRSGIFKKILSFLGLVFSLSIISNMCFNKFLCKYDNCNGIIGEKILYLSSYTPKVILFILSFLIFVISISFLLDIRKNWWLVKFTRLYRFIKRNILNIINFCIFIFRIFTTKFFREKLKRFFKKIFSRKSRNFVFVDEENIDDKNIENNIEENFVKNVNIKEKHNKLINFFSKSKNKNNIESNEKNEEKIKDSEIAENTENIKNISKIKQSINIGVKNKKQNIYLLPTEELLSKNNKVKNSISKSELLLQSEKLLEVLKDFSIKGVMLQSRSGPIITLHEFEPAAGTKSSRVIGLSDDIARSMSAVSTRISVIPGKNAMGIELPNKQRETIYIRDLIESTEYKNSKAQLPMIIGSDIAGDAVVADLAKMPHLLVAGTTGSGKSVAINTMITSLLYKMTPDQCKFIMIDPKMLELSVYEGIPHLLTPVVTEPLKAITALKWVCREMEDRYRIMASLGVRNIAGYNEKLNNAIKSGTKLTRRVQTGFDSQTDKPIYEEKEIEEKEMPYIVVIVDEMADLMITAGKEIEASIQRIAQKARAAGIHIIMATQRPSVDVITGVIKANFPTRISFQVVSKIDSRTILGEQGAEQLLGMGDMLYMAGGGKIVRAHGPFVSDSEVEKIVNFIKSQGFEPNYVDEVLKNEDEFTNDVVNNIVEDGFENGGENNLYQQALNIIKRDKKCSISYIQRQLRIGYNKAANIIEEMERNGILSSPNNTGKREILIFDNEDN